MTDEDLRKTVADIRQASHDVDMVKSMLETAADEIERLAMELASANRLLEIGRSRALAKSGGLEIKQSVAQSDAESKMLWEACACLEEWTETEWAQKHAYSIYKRTMDVLPKFKAILDAACAAEPVAWRWRWHSDPADVWNFADHEIRSELMTIDPLYTARPQPGSGSKL